MSHEEVQPQVENAAPEPSVGSEIESAVVTSKDMLKDAEIVIGLVRDLKARLATMPKSAAKLFKSLL